MQQYLCTVKQPVIVLVRQISILSSSSVSLLAYDVCSVVVSYRAMFGGCHTLGE